MFIIFLTNVAKGAENMNWLYYLFYKVLLIFTLLFEWINIQSSKLQKRKLYSKYKNKIHELTILAILKRQSSKLQKQE